MKLSERKNLQTTHSFLCPVVTFLDSHACKAVCCHLQDGNIHASHSSLEFSIFVCFQLVPSADQKRLFSWHTWAAFWLQAPVTCSNVEYSSFTSRNAASESWDCDWCSDQCCLFPTTQPTHCYNIPREYNLAIGQKGERPLPRECLLWGAHLSPLWAAHGWTLTGTVVCEAGLSAGLHRLFISLLESWSVNMDSDNLQPCVSRHGVKNFSN